MAAFLAFRNPFRAFLWEAFRACLQMAFQLEACQRGAFQLEACLLEAFQADQAWVLLVPQPG